MKRVALILGAAFSLVAKAAFAATVIYLTSGTTWTAPADFNSRSNTVEIVGQGGVGGTRSGVPTQQGGGGGGAYIKANNVPIAPGATVSVHFGTDSVWILSSSVAKAESGFAGSDPSNGTLGGRASNSVGAVKFSGGSGAFGINGASGPGGGAAGPHGVGSNGDSTSLKGGDADAGFGGAGGAGNLSGGAANPGAAGTEFNVSHGAGGGAGASTSGAAAAGGAYGGGSSSTNTPGGGLIVITYIPGSRISMGVF